MREITSTIALNDHKMLSMFKNKAVTMLCPQLLCFHMSHMCELIITVEMGGIMLKDVLRSCNRNIRAFYFLRILLYTVHFYLHST